jgi:hypothetical protein
MFSASGANFGCHLQCFLPLEQILAATCNVFCLWSKFWLLFAMFSASGANFGCYLQCFGLDRFLGLDRVFGLGRGALGGEPQGCVL